MTDQEQTGLVWSEEKTESVRSLITRVENKYIDLEKACNQARSNWVNDSDAVDEAIDELQNAIDRLGLEPVSVEAKPDPDKSPVSGRKWSQRSLDNLKGISPQLRKICDRALVESPYDFVVIDGLRTIEEQQRFFDKGTSKTMDSYHLTGHAIDFIPIVNGKVIVNPTHMQLGYFQRVAATFHKVAERLGSPIISGALDWGWDYYHIQLRDRY